MSKPEWIIVLLAAVLLGVGVAARESATQLHQKLQRQNRILEIIGDYEQ